MIYTRPFQSRKLIRMSIIITMLVSLMVSLLPLNSQTVLAASTVTINPNNVISTNFLGIGAEFDPFQFMPEDTKFGYNDAYWELEKLRMQRMGVKMVRVRFQPDWFMDDWYVYDWNSPRMLAAYKFFDGMKQIGVEIELDFGWKVSFDAHGWYSFASLPAWQKKDSAPNNLDGFAAAASVALDMLITQKGYTNIKYLTFSNEPELEDFEGPLDQKAYYKDMAVKVHDKLILDGRRGLVQIWGPEQTAGTDWVQYMAANAPQVFDYYSFHKYTNTVTDFSTVTSSFRAFTDPIGKSTCMTEFGRQNESYRETGDYGLWMTEASIRSANDQVKCQMAWRMADQYMADPATGRNNPNDALHYGLHKWGFWNWMPDNLNPRPSYYAFSLLTRYIDKNSNVLSTTSSDAGLLAATYKNTAGEYTLVVVNNDAVAKSATFNFSNVNINKVLGRHVYTSSVALENNAMLIARDATTYSAGTSFTDNSIPAKSVVVYTSKSPELQVKVTPNNNTVMQGNTLQLSASIIDGTGGVTWSVIGTGNGTVSAAGLYTAPAASPYKVIAVRATSTANPAKYGIAMIKVGHPNLALNKNVTVSSSEEANGWNMVDAVDGKQDSNDWTARGWSSNNTIDVNHTEWIQMDLGVNETIDTVTLYPRNDTGFLGTGFPIDFKIDVSTDGLAWTSVVNKTGYPALGDAGQKFTFAATLAKYVKVTGTNLRINANGKYRLQLAEIEVYGTSKMPNRAILKVVTASSSEEANGWHKVDAVDGKLDTNDPIARGWSSNNTIDVNHTEWVQVDFGTNHLINKVDLHPRDDAGWVGSGFPIDYTIQVSTDGINWTTMVTKTGFSLPSDAGQSFTFAPVSTRYVKVNGTNLRVNANLKYRMQIAEIEAY